MFNIIKYNIPTLENNNFLEPCTTLRVSCTPPCIDPSSTKLTLSSTLEFIRTHPVLLDGQLVKVSLLLKTSLLTDQDSGAEQPVEVIESTIHGHIEKVYCSYVVINNDSGCQTPQEYIINIDDILQVVHPAIGQYFGEYVELMDSLPALCSSCQNNDLDLLNILAETIRRHYIDPKKAIALIIDGIQTDNFPVSAYCIQNNLVIVEGFFVIPITSIAGFALNPIC